MPLVAGALLLSLGVLYSTQGEAAELWNSYVQAWIYPGNPACAASTEYSDGRVIQALKPEYYNVGVNGDLILRTTLTDGCNGYSATNAAAIKKYSKEQYVTVSSDRAAMIALASSSLKRTAAVATLATFVKTVGFSGVELDFEEFSQWSASDYSNFKTFIKELGTSLHAQGLALLVDVPAISNATEQGYYPLKYEDFNSLPVDRVVIMAYDYQYDYSAGKPIAPNAWVTGIVNWSKGKITDINKIVIGLPAYGYHGKTDGYSITIDTLEQSKKLPGYTTATRDAGSYEMHWNYGGTSYFYQDSTGLNLKRTLIESLGIKNISVWHLGGNSWFSGKSEPTTSQPLQPTPCPLPV